MKRLSLLVFLAIFLMSTQAQAGIGHWWEGGELTGIAQWWEGGELYGTGQWWEGGEITQSLLVWIQSLF